MNFHHSLVRDGLAHLDEAIFVESLPTGSPALRVVRSVGLFVADGWRLIAHG